MVFWKGCSHQAFIIGTLSHQDTQLAGKAPQIPPWFCLVHFYTALWKAE